MPSILITGSNQGLGFETARQIAQREDVHLFVSGRTEEKVKEAVETIKSAAETKAKIDYVIIDLTSDESIYAAAKSVETKLAGKGLDALVNNAAVALDLKMTDPKDRRKLLQETYNTNVFGTIVVTEAFLPLLKKGTEPRVVNIGSDLGCQTRIADPNDQFSSYVGWAYSTSKSAVQGLTITTARLHPEIHAVVLNPGYNATALNGYSGYRKPEDGVKVIVQHALARVGKSPGSYENEGEMPW